MAPRAERRKEYRRSWLDPAPKEGHLKVVTKKSELDKSLADVWSCSSEEEAEAQPTVRGKTVSKIKVHVHMRVDVGL